MTEKPALTGQCHCGNLTVDLAITKPVDAIGLRACQCTFCRRHGATALSDPEGSAVLTIGAAGVQRYRFGLEISDFLVCPHCGIFVGAVMPDEDGLIGVLNPTGLGISEFAGVVPQPMDYDGEDVDGRTLRRKGKWMPVRIIEA